MITNKKAAAAPGKGAAAAAQSAENQTFEVLKPSDRFLYSLILVGYWTVQVLPFAISAAVLIGGLFLITY